MSIVLFAMFMVTVSALAQTKTITGQVLDNLGEPVIGANIQVKGTSEGTMTDANGNFSLKVADNATLRVSFIGYTTQDVKVGNKSKLTISLEEDSQTLDDVIVVGYGVQRKSDVTGATARIGAKELAARPVNDALQGLQGKTAGVDITTNERPGELGSILIRGSRSLTASNSPLYVVDGVPLMSASAIETLNPRDIESIDILKDASATAIYGSRGANGVILVTTKQGKSGKFSLDYSGTVTISNIVDRSPSMSAADYIEYRRWAAYNSNPDVYAHPDSPTKENDANIFNSPCDNNSSRDNVLRGWANGKWDPSLVVDTDWTDLVTQTAISHEHTLSASGGNETMKTYASFGYLRNEGTQKGQFYDRYTGKLNLSITPTKWFTIDANMSITWTEQDYGMSTLGGRSGSVPDGIYLTAKAIPNIGTLYDADGNRVINPTNEAIYTIWDEWEHSQQKRQAFRALGNIAATVDFGKIFAPLKGLRYKINFGPDFRNWREGAYIDGFSSHKINADGSEGKNYARLQNRRDFSWTLDNMIMYDRTFAEKHKVGVTLLQTASKWNYETSSMAANNIEKDSYLWNAFGTVDLTNPDNSASMSSGINDRQLASYMVRLNYGFNERYMLTVSGRWDGASQLAEGHKWDFFPSAALAWRLNEESFMKPIEWISNLKFRLGVGTTGNAAVSPYTTKGKISGIYLPFNGLGNLLGYTTNEPYYTANQLKMANTELGWEKTTQWNIGIDYGFLKNRISGSVEFYWSTTNDVIYATTIPTLTGFPSTDANVAKTKNHGIEFTLNAVPVQTRDFTWDTSFNIAYQKDEIVETALGKVDMPDNKLFIGESLSVFYGYQADGVWQESDAAEMAKWAENGYNFTAGNVRPHDVNGDYKMDNSDRMVIGNRNPTTTLGWNNNFSYKGIDLSISMFGRMGYTFNTGGYALVGNGNQVETDYWTPKNPGAEYQKPILSQITSGSQDQFSSLLGYKNASFIKVRNISLGYNFPKKLLKSTALSHLKIYAQCTNPFNIYQSVNGFDLDTGRTYFNRSVVFGLEIGF